MCPKIIIFLQHHRLRDNWPINQLMAVTQEPSVVARQLAPHIEAHIVVHVIRHLKIFCDNTNKEIIGQLSN